MNAMGISMPQYRTACVAAYNNGKKCMFLLQIAIVKNFIHGRIVVLSSPHRVTFRTFRSVHEKRNLGVHSKNNRENKHIAL